MADTPYCTAQNVLDVLQTLELEESITIQEDDPVYLARAWEATRWIERQTKRVFREREYTERYEGAGTQMLVLRQYPVISIEMLRAFNWSFSQYRTYVPADYYLDAEKGIIYLTYSPNAQNLYGVTGGVLGSMVFPPGRANIEVQYTAGYETVPDDIIEATAKKCVLLCLTAHVATVTDGLQSFSLDGLSLQFGQGLFKQSAEQWEKDIDGIIAYYKRNVVGRA